MAKSTFIKKLSAATQNQVAGGIFIALFAIVGVWLLVGGHAATPYISTSAGSGTPGCNASIQQDAQNNNYVKFGSGTSCGGGGSGPGLGGGASMLVGVNEGTGHGTTGAQQAAAVGGFDRLDATSMNTSLIASTVKTFSDNGVKVDLLIGSGSADSWVSFYKNVCQVSGLQANECPTVEIENEPDLNGVSPQTYAATLEADYKAFHALASPPVVIGAYEGGSTSSFTFGSTWWNYNPDTGQNSSAYMAKYTDAVYVHPYGHHVNTSVCSSPYNTYTLSGAPCSVIDSALGDRGAVIKVHSDTGKPIIITEVGWPAATSNGGNITSNSAGATGDSYGWPYINCASSPGGTSCSGGGFSSPQGDQCNNVYNFITWARNVGYVYGVTYFGINDYSSNGNVAYYGILDLSGNKKPAFNALAAAAFNKSNPCPNPLTY